jgi:predicted metallo-beta-lactamase superfamily hydrolase
MKGAAMQIDILAAESLGVRGLCCFIEAQGRKILIDPGIALGYLRNGLLPHPAQVAVDEAIRTRIVEAWTQATDIVFSHFHGDHVPLVGANPYQVDAHAVIDRNPRVRIWTKPPESLSPTEQKRTTSLEAVLDADWRIGLESHGPMTFSPPVPHGEKADPCETVMMTKVRDKAVFVHASDIQLLDDAVISLVLRWKPDILLAGGPPLYLRHLREDQRDRAWNNALRLATAVDRLILDHHLLRSWEGLEWLRRLSKASGREVLCAADFMGKPRLLLEADRVRLYGDMPPPFAWHEDYAAGKATTHGFRKFIS